MNDDRTPSINADTQISTPKSMPPPRPEKLNKSLIAETKTPTNPDLLGKNKDNLPLNALETEISRRLLQMPRMSVPLFAAALSRDRQLNFQPFFSSLGVSAPGDSKTASKTSSAADALNRLQVSSIAGLYQFQRGVALPYMRKSLSLSYEHVVLTKSLVALTGSMAQMLEAKLEAIKLNTAAPDYRKSESLWQGFRRKQREQLLTKAASFATAQASVLAKAAYAKAKPHLEERIYKPAAENYRAYRSGTKSASDIMAEAQAAARRAYEDGYNQFSNWKNKQRGPSFSDFMASRDRERRYSQEQDHSGSDGAIPLRIAPAPLRLTGPLAPIKPPSATTGARAAAPGRPAPPTIDHNEHDAFLAHPMLVQAQQQQYFKAQGNRESKSSSGKQGCIDCCDDLIKRLDNIHNLMKTHFTRQEKMSADTLRSMNQEARREEAPRAGSYADHMRELLAKHKAAASAGAGFAGAAAQGNMPGGTTPAPTSSSWLSELLGTGAAGLVGGTFAKYAGKAGKGLWAGARSGSRFAAPILGGLGALGLGSAGKLAKFAGRNFLEGGKLTGSLASSLMGSISGKSLSPLGHWLGSLASGGVGTAAKGAVEGAELGGSSLLKTIGKKIPGIGALLGAGLSIKDLFDGEYVNAAGDLASGLASTIPGVGTAASLAIDGAMLYRNMNRKKPTSIPTAPGAPSKPGALSRTLFGSEAEVSNGKVVKKAEGSIVDKLWSTLFGSKTEQTADGQIVKDGQLGIIGNLRHGTAQTLRFMSNSIFGQYDADGNRIQGSSYLEQSEAALAKAWGKGKSIIEQTAAGLKQGVKQFGGFLFGTDGGKSIIGRTWDSLTATVSDWGKTLSDLASSAWHGVQNAPGAIADAASAAGQHVADAASAVGGALAAAPGQAYNAISSGASAVATGVSGAASSIWNKVTGGSSSDGHNTLQDLANAVDTKPSTVTVPLPSNAPPSLPAVAPSAPVSSGGVPPAPAISDTSNLPKGVVGDGQCVALVKKAANIGPTATWSPGDRVLGNADLKPGTVIATFGESGKYENRTDGSSHAAIYLGPSLTKPGGIRVYDQWAGHPASIRDIGLTGSPVDNASFFRVVNAGGAAAQAAGVAPPTASSLPTGGVSSAAANTNSPTPGAVSMGGAAPPVSGGGSAGAMAIPTRPNMASAAGPAGSPIFSANNDNHLPNRTPASSPISGPIAFNGPGSGGAPPSAARPISGPPAAPGVSGGAPAGPITGASFAAKSPQIVSRLQADFGLTPAQAAGIVGNLGHESGGFKQLQEINPIGGGRGGLGWAQWTGPRRVAFEKYLADTGQDAHSDEANYGFLKQELQTTQKAAITAVKKTNDVGGAVSAFEASFERANPKYVHMESREKYAQQALAGTGATPTQMASKAGGPSPAGGMQVAANGVGVPPPNSGGTQSAPGGLPASGIIPASFDQTKTPATPIQVAAVSPSMIPSPSVITNGAIPTPSVTKADLPSSDPTLTAPAAPNIDTTAAAAAAAADPTMLQALHSITGAITDMHATIASGKMMGATNDLLQAHLEKPNTVVAPVTNNTTKGAGSQGGGTQNDLDFSKAVNTATAAA